MLVETKASDLKDRIKMISNSLGQKADGECLVTASKTDGLTLEGFKDGTYLKCTLPAEVHQEGEVVVKSAYLTSLRLGAKVRLTLNNNWLDFQSGSFQGHVETSQDVDRFKASRPAEIIPTPFNLAAEDFVECTKRAFLQPTLVGQPYGIRCQLYGDEQNVESPVTLALSSIESNVRAVIAKKQLPIVLQREPGTSHTFMDVMLPPILWSIVSKVKGPIQIGTDGKVFHLLSAAVDLYQPLLAFEAQDIEMWIEQLQKPPSVFSGELHADVQTFLGGINQATSVVVSVGAPVQEITLDCVATAEVLKIDVRAASGEATSELPLTAGPQGELKMQLGARHMTESLGLLGSGSAEVKVWSNPAAVLVYSGPKPEEIAAETDPEKQNQLRGQMQTYYIIPQIAKDS